MLRQHSDQYAHELTRFSLELRQPLLGHLVFLEDPRLDQRWRHDSFFHKSKLNNFAQRA